MGWSLLYRRQGRPQLPVFSAGTFSAPWAALARSREQYCLAWEAKYLMELGNALETILSGLANMVAQEALKYTVLSGKPPLSPPPAASPRLLHMPEGPSEPGTVLVPRNTGEGCMWKVHGLCREETDKQPLAGSPSVWVSNCCITSHPIIQ